MQDEFSAGYPKMVIPHHWLSLGWFGLWVAFAAPAGPEGAPIWNTVRARTWACQGGGR